MDTTRNILRTIPLFKHCTAEEMNALYKKGTVARIKKGQRLDVKVLKSLCIILEGVFEIESIGSSDVVYLASGSFFGNVPFVQDRQHGVVKALTESSLLVIEEEVLKSFFLGSFKALRGYGAVLQRLGFDAMEAARKIQDIRCRVVTVYSLFDKTGKSLLASLLGARLSEGEKSIILDVSNRGTSIFDFFNRKITPPLSQKQTEGASTESLLEDRIESISENLSLLNVSFGAKVKIDPRIISPLLFYLSQHYKYIILDLAPDDEDLVRAVFEGSDIILGVTRMEKSRNRMTDFIDEHVTQGQRVISIYNEYAGGTVKQYQGGIILEKLTFKKEETGGISSLFECQSETLNGLVELITRKNRCLVMESGLFEAVAMAPWLEKERGGFTSCYTSSFSYLVLVLFLLSQDKKETYERIRSFFSDSRVNGMLDIVFPEEHVFKTDKIVKRMHEIAGNRKIESFSTSPLAFASSGGGKGRIFSSGLLRNVMTVSFLMEPVFESLSLYGEEYYSGYPFLRAGVEEILRTDVDDITFLTVQNSSVMRFKNSRLLKFYQNFSAYLNDMSESRALSELADRSVTISIDQKYFSVDALLESEEER